MLGANIHTGRLQPDIYAVGTIITFRGRIRFRVNVQGIVGAGLHTRFAPDTSVVVKINDTVGARKQRFSRANFDTGRVRTMITPHDGKQSPGVRKDAFFNLFDPGSIDADRHVMLRFAGCRTGVAANTFSIVNYKSVSHLKFVFSNHNY